MYKVKLILPVLETEDEIVAMAHVLETETYDDAIAVAVITAHLGGAATVFDAAKQKVFDTQEVSDAWIEAALPEANRIKDLATKKYAEAKLAEPHRAPSKVQ